MTQFAEYKTTLRSRLQISPPPLKQSTTALKLQLSLSHHQIQQTNPLAKYSNKPPTTTPTHPQSWLSAQHLRTPTSAFTTPPRSLQRNCNILTAISQGRCLLHPHQLLRPRRRRRIRELLQVRKTAHAHSTLRRNSL